MITSVGQRFGERYVLRERIAVGGMGEVWSAVDEVLNRPVAVKVLRTDLAPDANFQARFRAEARTAAALTHGGIAAVYDYGEALGSAFLVMELVPGDPLSALIADEGALGSERTLSIVSQAARALHEAHRHGVIHRDIKPANLMITPDVRVKVTDFGIARPRDHEPLTATGQVMGTAHYLAPELARGETASPLSDVYALGVVAYECLTGWRPFEGDNQVAVATAHLQDEPPPLPETIPANIRGIVMSAMAKNPAKRPQGANVLASLMEDARLRGLAGSIDLEHDSDLAPAPRSGDSWPLDNDPQAHQSGRRNAALDRAAGPGGGSRQSAWEARNQRQQDRDSRDSSYSSPPSSSQEFPSRREARAQQQQQQQSGYRQQPEYDDQYDDDQYYDEGQQSRSDSRAPYTGGDSGYDRQDRYDYDDQPEDDPFSSLGTTGGGYPSRSGSRSRANHGRGSASGGYPAENSSSGRRRLSMPLAALIALVVVVAVVAFMATRSDAATRSLDTSGLRSGHVSSSVLIDRNSDVVTGVGIRG